MDVLTHTCSKTKMFESIIFKNSIFHSAVCTCESLNTFLPQESPWWREGVALQGGEGVAQQNGEQCSSASAQTVTGDDQFILLQTIWKCHNTQQQLILKTVNKNSYRSDRKSLVEDTIVDQLLVDVTRRLAHALHESGTQQHWSLLKHTLQIFYMRQRWHSAEQWG